MRKALISLTVISLTSLSPFALADNDGPGCGWGQMVWKGQTGLMPHISAATTNGTSSNQLFGLTSGTAGCDGDNSVVDNDYQRKVFAAANFDSLAQEAAQGHGEHLASLATLMGVEETDRSAFYSLTQHQYTTLFDSPNINYIGMLSALDTAMLANPQLVRYVR